MTGFLVVNHFLTGEKFDTLHNHLIKSAEKQGIELIKKTNQEMIFEKKTPDFVLFWDKDINLAERIEKSGTSVFNSAKSIALCDDKAKTYTALKGIVKQPETIPAPLAFFKSDYSEFVSLAVERLGLPVVYKECFGSFGEQVHLCRNTDEVMKCISGRSFLLQEYIEANGTDIRIEVVNGECVCAMKRHNEHDFRSNITNGGTAEPYIPNENEKSLAIRACTALGLTFGGIDIIGGDMVCEVNSNAHIINIMKATGIDTAEKIFRVIQSKI